MLRILMLQFLFYTANVYCQVKQELDEVNKEEKNEKSIQENKVYTKSDFNKKVREEVERIINRIQTKNFSKLSLELLEKENKLEIEKKDIENQKEQLAQAEKELAKKLINLENGQKKLIGCADENVKNNNLRAIRIVEIINGMKPTKAAEVLSIQESEIAVKILEILDPVKSSKIFNLMDKEISARLQKQYLNMKK